MLEADAMTAPREWMSPVFGDVVAKIKFAAHKEIERRLRLGLPVVIDRGNGVEGLTAWPDS